MRKAKSSRPPQPTPATSQSSAGFISEIGPSIDVEISIDQEIGDYLSELEFERRLSPRSLAVYRHDLDQLSILLKQCEGNAATFKSSCRKLWLKLKASTVARKATIWRGFLKRNLLRWSEIYNSIVSPRNPPQSPRFLTEAEAFRLEATCYKEKPVFRSRALIGLLLGLGLRLTEALHLKWGDIEGEWLIIKRKGGKTQRLPLTPSLKSILSMWKSESCALSPEDFIFPGRSGAPLSSRAAQFLLKRLGEKSQITKSLHPHALRHTFATHLAAKGANLAALKELLGHAQLSTTERYLHVTPEYLRQTVNLLQG